MLEKCSQDPENMKFLVPSPRVKNHQLAHSSQAIKGLPRIQALLLLFHSRDLTLPLEEVSLGRNVNLIRVLLYLDQEQRQRSPISDTPPWLQLIKTSKFSRRKKRNNLDQALTIILQHRYHSKRAKYLSVYSFSAPQQNALTVIKTKRPTSRNQDLVLILFLV